MKSACAEKQPYVHIAYKCALLVCLLLVGCPSSPSAPAEPKARSQVRYFLERTGKHIKALGHAWETTTDRGYRVRLTRGYLTTHSVELVGCSPPQASGPLSWLEGFSLAPRRAYAGHGTKPNPAAIRQPQVESLLALGRSEMGTATPGNRQYCQIHYLLARASSDAIGLPNGLDVVDQTVHLEGTWSIDGGPEMAFLSRAPIAHGDVVDLYPPGHYGDRSHAFVLDTGTRSASVVIRRNLDHLFDRIDFSSANDKQISRQALANLIQHLQIEVEAQRVKP